MKNLVRSLGVFALSLSWLGPAVAQLPAEAVPAAATEPTPQPADAKPASKVACIPTSVNRPPVEARAQRKVQQSCTYSVVLAVAGDDAWEVFVNGTRLSPTNGSNENLWYKPARYQTTVSGGSELIIGIHVRDVSSVQSGMLAWARIRRLSPPTVLPDWVVPTGSGNGWYAFQQPLVNAQPVPSNWNTAPFLPFDPPTAADWAPATLAANDCTSLWNANSTFLSNWASASGGAPPSDWLWEYSCRANTKPWRKENWYRLELPLDTCPADVPPPKKGCTWKLSSHGAADGLFDSPPVQGCSVNANANPLSATCIDSIGCGWNQGLCKYICGFDFWTWECVPRRFNPDTALPNPHGDRKD